MSIPTTARLIGLLAAPALLVSACGSGSSYGNSPSSSPSSSSSSPGGATAAAVHTHQGSMGTYLTDAKGRSLYLLTADKGSTSTCSGPCAQAWPPFTTTGTPQGMGKAGSGHLATTKRGDGTMQVTYDGHPLYYFAQDSGAGDTAGEGIKSFGGTWWLVAPTGKALKSGGSSSGGGYAGY